MGQNARFLSLQQLAVLQVAAFHDHLIVQAQLVILPHFAAFRYKDVGIVLILSLIHI